MMSLGLALKAAIRYDELIRCGIIFCIYISCLVRSFFKVKRYHPRATYRSFVILDGFSAARTVELFNNTATDKLEHVQ